MTSEGAAVQEALQRPLTEEEVKKQMQKTGQTDFVFQDLELEMTGPVFLPVRDLNALRRDGLNQLREKLLEGYRRTPPPQIRPDLTAAGYKKPAKERTGRLAVLASDPEQVKAAADNAAVSRIYVDAGIGFSEKIPQRARKNGAEVFLALPYIFRDRTRKIFASLYESILAWYDGVLVRNWDEAAWLFKQGYPGRITADQNLYVLNRESARFLAQAGLYSWTAPAELNARELRALNIEGQTLIVYGYQPVMVSAGCLRKTTTGCLRDRHGDGDKGRMTLTDERHHSFPVKMVCPYCYNLIYNSVPLFLLDQQEEIRRLRPGFLRLDFTTETRTQTEEVIKSCADGADLPVPEFTRGHFKRGVI